MRQAARYLPAEDDEGDDVGEEEPTNDEEDALSDIGDGDGEVGDDEPDDDTDEVDANESGPRFIPGSCLPKSTVAKIRIVELVRLLGQGYLDLNADYQREVVWPKEKMSSLVTSVMEDFYIPPLIFNVTTIMDAMGTERVKRICVDGKQRLSSVRAFLAGEIPVFDHAGKKWYYQEGNAKSKGPRVRNLLSESWKQKFCRKEFFCYELPDLTTDQEEDLFSRVQLGVPLTAAEKLRASRGPWQDEASLFEDEYRQVVRLCRDARSSGWQNLLACFSQIMEVTSGDWNGGSTPKLKAGAHTIKKLIRRPDLLDDALRARLHRTFTTFKRLILHDASVFLDTSYARSKNFSPLEMVAVAVLISQYGESRTDALLCGDIALFRKEIRRVHRDLFLNAECWRTAWTFIEDLESLRGATDGSTRVNPRSEAARRARATQGAGGHDGEVPSTATSGHRVQRTKAATSTDATSNTAAPAASAPVTPVTYASGGRVTRSQAKFATPDTMSSLSGKSRHFSKPKATTALAARPAPRFSSVAQGTASSPTASGSNNAAAAGWAASTTRGDAVTASDSNGAVTAGTGATTTAEDTAKASSSIGAAATGLETNTAAEGTATASGSSDAAATGLATNTTAEDTATASHGLSVHRPEATGISGTPLGASPNEAGLGTAAGGGRRKRNRLDLDDLDLDLIKKEPRTL